MEKDYETISIFDFNPAAEELVRLRLNNISKESYLQMTNSKVRLIDLSMLFLFRDDALNSIKFVDMALGTGQSE